MSAESGNGECRSDETVLIAEDEAALRRFVRALLELDGYTVLEAGDGPTALQVAAAHRGSIQLLLSDVVMPGGLSGPDLAEAFARQHPGAAVLLMSGHTDEQVLRHGLCPETMEFLRKPFGATVLRERVRELLSRTA